MTLEIDLDRVAAVTDRLRRHQTATADIAHHLAGVGQRMQLLAEVLAARLAAERLGQQLGLTAAMLDRRADEASRADAADEQRTFAGGTALCSAIQVASPIPARPSTGGVTGAIDAAGIARDAWSVADTAKRGTATIAGRSVPITSLAAAIADVLLCRLNVGSGAAISTRTIVDEDGQMVYESSRSPHKNLAANGEVLDPDPVRRDRQIWRIEHSNENGFLMVPYPGYPAYEVNAPRG